MIRVIRFPHYLERPPTSSKQSMQDEVQSSSNPGTSAWVSDTTDATEHGSLASTSVEVQYQPGAGGEQCHAHTRALWRDAE